jgi:hypothetical protein
MIVIASEAKQSRSAARDCFGVLRTPRNDNSYAAPASRSSALRASAGFHHGFRPRSRAMRPAAT